MRCAPYCGSIAFASEMKQPVVFSATGGNRKLEGFNTFRIADKIEYKSMEFPELYAYKRDFMLLAKKGHRSRFVSA